MVFPDDLLEPAFPEPPALGHMSVVGLFGKYDYEIPFSHEGVSEDQEPLTLLYGKNGSGKSTVWRLLYHGLSSSRRRGHYTALAAMPYHSVTFTFANGDR